MIQISYRNGWTKIGDLAPERIPVLSFYIHTLDEEYSIDLEELADALKPFLEDKND